jgi:hypothetical protein
MWDLNLYSTKGYCSSMSNERKLCNSLSFLGMLVAWVVDKLHTAVSGIVILTGLTQRR